MSLNTHLCRVFCKHIIEIVNFWWFGDWSIWFYNSYTSIEFINPYDILTARINFTFVHWSHTHHNPNVFDFIIIFTWMTIVFLFFLQGKPESIWLKERFKQTYFEKRTYRHFLVNNLIWSLKNFEHFFNICFFLIKFLKNFLYANWWRHNYAFDILLTTIIVHQLVKVIIWLCYRLRE